MSARNPQQIFDALLDGIVILDSSQKIEQANIEACRILETSLEVITGKTLPAVLGHKHLANQLIESTISTQRSSTTSELVIERRFAQDLIVDITASPLIDPEDSTLSGIIVIFRDRTIQSALQELSIEKDRLHAFGRIAAGIAHEVKNPLGGIRGAAELLGARVQTEKEREIANLIVRETDRITTLVDDLMVFARNDELKLEKINIYQILDDVLDLLSHDPISQKSQIHRIYDPSIPEFHADKARLTQVFLNLARNALQAMEEEGGVLTISTRLLLDHRTVSEIGETLSMIEIEIHNTGPEIPKEILDHVLTPFFTTRPNGTGLGLPLANHWVSRHGGNLRIRSKKESGTRVQITLPLRRKK